ncbi:maleylacetoacetate isomerase [Parendozoicomonas haliclonae]|uniref:Maleylpyruvate isomerase n=1 Tax=Parendozoicomonas haliclonae TaxID=1960125 RepID=A0A1X7AJD0_9GAMM|nr:maleylacetoacetate isomerase [Parendozoicomonas haliclonae]SMA46299.1 Maleylpyruvate isomerase [Parendozoicomonas haliclonae]
MKLYDYFYSSAAFRTRIALNLKGLEYEQIPVNLRTGQQSQSDYKAQNPQGLVPALSVAEGTLGQSLAIIEWLEETYPEIPLLPKAPWDKARVRAMAYTIACDIHPLNNLRVLNYLKDDLEVTEQQKTEWYHHWIGKGFDALEQQVEAAPFCFGDKPTLADVCLIPQIKNAMRFEMDLSPYPKLRSIWEHCMTLDAFVRAMPENQETAG